MNKDIREQFEEKNCEILNNKLTVDLNNNSDSLNITIENAINLHMIKLEKSLSSIVDEEKIKVDMNEFKTIFTEERPLLKEALLELVKGRRLDLLDYLSTRKAYEETYLEDYLQKIDETKNKFGEDLRAITNEKILSEFGNKIIKACNFKEEEEKEKISSSIIINLQQPLIETISDNNDLRSNNLKNFSKDSFNHYLELTRVTTNTYDDEKGNKEKKKTVESKA